MRKNFTLLTCCLLLISQFTIAQSDAIQWYPGVKLKYSDFSVDQSKSHVFTDIVVRYTYSLQPTQFSKYFPIVHTSVILNRSTATLPDSNKNTLRYAQLLFDLSGYESRLIKLKVFELGVLDGRTVPVKTSIENALSQATDEVSQLKKDMTEQLSSLGNDQIFSEWEAKMDSLLRTTPDIIEESNPGKFQLGVFIGITQSIFTGKTADYFTNATGMNLGFNVDLKKSRLGIDMNLDLNKTKQELESKGYWQAKMKTHFASFEVTYGIKLLKNNWLSVPFAGFSVNELTPAKSDKEDKRKLTGYSPVIGFEINRYFGKRNDSYESTSFFYKCRASINPSNLIKDYGGTQFNLKLAIGFDASKMKRKMVKKQG